MTPPLYISIFGKKIYAFHFFGVLGYLVGNAGGAWLASELGLSPIVILILGAGGAFMFFFQTIITKVFTEKEELVYYRHEIGILLFSFFLLKTMSYPVLPYLEITLLGIGVFLAFGRIGCFSVGCCYGIPSPIGVCYNHQHKAAGFPRHLENITLLPVQLLESFWVTVVVALGTYLLLTDEPAGTALGCYTVLYGSYRILIEFLRWDHGRPTWLGFSEAQWTTSLLLVALLFSEWNGWIPFYSWHFVFAGMLVPIVLLLWIIVLNYFARYKITSPEHFEEIANFVNQYLEGTKIKTIHDFQDSGSDNVNVFKTSKGLKLSSGKIKPVNGVLYHFSVSHTTKTMDKKRVKAIADFINKVILTKFEYKIENPDTGLFHILFSPH